MPAFNRNNYSTLCRLRVVYLARILGVMSEPTRTINVRLPVPLAEKFDRLAQEVPGLPKGAVLRALISDQLGKDLDEQVAIITRQILRSPKSAVRIPLNTNQKRHGIE